jgi:uridine kinase
VQQEEAMREARRKLSECWELRAESRRIQRDYQERQRKIEDLMRRYDVERA